MAAWVDHISFYVRIASIACGYADFWTIWRYYVARIMIADYYCGGIDITGGVIIGVFFFAYLCTIFM